MDLIRIYAHRRDRKAVLERLQRLGVMEIADSRELPGGTDDGFDRPDMEEQAAAFDRLANTAQQALDILGEAVPESKGMLASLSGRREVTEEAFAASAARSKAILQDCHHIQALKKKQAEQAAEAARLRTAAAQLEPWLGLDVPFRFSGTKTTAAYIGALPAVYSTESLAAALAEKAPDVSFDLEIIGEPKEQTCVFLLCLREEAEELEQALRALGFARPPVIGSLTPAIEGETGSSAELPAGEDRRIAERQAALEREMVDTRRELAGLADRRADIEMTVDYYQVRAEKYRVIGRLDHTRSTFIVTGYAPHALVPALTAQLESAYAVAVEAQPADPELAPVKLRNNAFVRPAESITEMYAMPLATDIDPTPVMSFFYYLFFGMMLSDAGYGLLLAFGAWFLLKKYRPEPGMQRNLRLFMYCGVSTVLWGLVFGSFFGDAPSVIAKTFFDVDFVMPRLLDPITDSITLLVLSLGLGFVQILVGLGARFYMSWRAGDKLGACFDTGLWMTTLIGFGLLAAGMALLPALQTVGAVVAAASLVGLVLTQGRKKKGPMKFISGLASLYDVTGYVSDLMSYSRLMALGLTTGVMGSVFNMLGAMFGKGIGGALAMIVIFLVGHGINFGINALGAYVHTIRLQYVELFSKFYEGGGRLFRPFAFHSKYVRIKEEMGS